MSKAAGIKNACEEAKSYEENLIAEVRLQLLKKHITAAIKLQQWYDDVLSGNIVRER